MNRRHCIAMLGSTVLFVNDYVLAQPSQSDRPVRLVVPFPAGGATDFVARAVGDALSKRWGKAVIVENRTGAAGVLGVSEAAKALPDGNTILLTVSATLINNAAPATRRSCRRLRRRPRLSQRRSCSRPKGH